MCKCIEEAAIFNEKKMLASLTYQLLIPSVCQSSSPPLLISSGRDLTYMVALFKIVAYNIIHKYLGNCDVIITKLKLSDSGLTTSSSSLISDIIPNCKVEVLGISSNHTIGESGELYTIPPLC